MTKLGIANSEPLISPLRLVYTKPSKHKHMKQRDFLNDQVYACPG